MCNELAKAIEMQAEYKVDTTKGATLLAKAAVKSMMKMNENFLKYQKEENDRFVKHQQEADARWNVIETKLENLQRSFDEYRTDATKYRLIVELVKALFGTTKRSIVTLMWVGAILGMFHLKDMVEVLKVLV